MAVGARSERPQGTRAPQFEHEREHEPTLPAPLPEGLRASGGHGNGNARRLGDERRRRGVAHGRLLPSTMTSANRAPDPPLEHRATSAPGTCAVGQSPRSWRTPLTTRWNCWAAIPGWL